MIKKSCFSLVLFLLLPLGSVAQPVFPPLPASPLEPRIGVEYFLSASYLQLNIGSRIALHRAYNWSLGAEFFTLSRLREEENFKFPVETIDYYFGVDLQMRDPNRLRNSWNARLRLGHISAHLVDGVFEQMQPFVYSREFLTLTTRFILGQLRILGELTWLFSSIPTSFAPLQPALGGELLFAGHPLSLTLAYEIRLLQFDNQVHPTHRGVMQVNSNNFPLMFGLVYYYGNSYHGMLYRQKENFITFEIRFRQKE